MQIAGIEAVFLDAGQTLIDVCPSVGEIYAREALRYGVKTDSKTLETVFRSTFLERCDDLLTGSSHEAEYRWWRDLVDEVFVRMGRRDAFRDRFDLFFGDLYEVFANPATWRLYGDVLPFLDYLGNRGIRRAVVSNWDSRLPELLERLGLAGHFERVICSAEAGFRKPDARIFHAALEALGVQADRAVHIGDSYNDDFAGARGAGLHAVLLDRGDRYDGTTPKVKSLAELAALLT